LEVQKVLLDLGNVAAVNADDLPLHLALENLTHNGLLLMLNLNIRLVIGGRIQKILQQAQQEFVCVTLSAYLENALELS